jgi:excisionase family DNA binding protein
MQGGGIMSALPDVLTPAQAAEFLQVNRHKIYELIRQRRIPAFKLGHRTVRIPREGLLDAIAEGGIFRGCYSIERKISDWERGARYGS